MQEPISVTTEPIWIKLETMNYLPKATPPCKTVSQCDDVRGLGKYPVCTCSVSLSFVFFGFLVTRTGRISGPILMNYTSYDVFQCKDLPFGGCIDTAPHLGGQIAQNSKF